MKVDQDVEKPDDTQSLLPKSSTPTFSVNDAVESAGFSRFQYILCALNGFSWIASSAEIMLLAILSPSLECEWQLNSVQQALCTTIFFAGWMVSSPVWGRVCDVHGRRKGLMAASGVGFVCGILTVFAPTFPIFLAARFGVGFSVGGQAQSVTLTAEFLPAAVRAKWLIFLKSGFAIGTAGIAALAIVVLPNLGWRWLVAFAAIPLGLFGVCCWWLPESARFDVAKGRMEEARTTLERVARINGKKLPEGELAADSEQGSSDMVDLLKPAHRRTTLQLWIIWTLFGFLFYGIAIYTSLLLHSAGDCQGEASLADDVTSKVKREAGCRHLTTDNYIDIIVTTLSEVPGYILTMYSVDIVGRRATFAVGFALLSACAGALTLCLPRTLMIIALFVARSAIAAVFQAGYIYTSEVYPTTLRAQGLGVASGCGRFGSMITPVITQMLFTLNQKFPAILYVGGGIVGAILSALLPVETSPKAAAKAQ